MLSLASASLGYTAPLARPALSGVSMTAITPGDIGTTKPLGIYDPLNLMTSMPDKYRRWQEMEIKHGRFAMAGTLHVILTMVTHRNSAPQLEPRAASRWTAACVRGVLDALATVPRPPPTRPLLCRNPASRRISPETLALRRPALSLIHI